MEKRNFIILLVLLTLLAISILLMGIALLVSEKTFALVSSYISIACVVVTLVGVVVVVRSNHKKKQNEKK